MCVGCGEAFDAAAGLMSHIENNKCKHITKDDFHKHRAEQQIERDAFDEMTGGLYHGASAMPGSTSDVGRGPNLLDDQRVPMELGQDWQDAAAEDLRRAGHGSSVGSVGVPGTITESMSALAIDKYPPLKAVTTSSTRRQLDTDTSSATTSNSQGKDLLDITKEAEVKPGIPSIGNHNVWTSHNRPTSLTSQGPNTRQSPSLNQKASGINLLDFDSTVNGTTFGRSSSVATRGTLPTQPPSIPPSAPPPNLDPNAPNAQIQLKPSRLILPTHLDLQSYWSPISQTYICPGTKCGRSLRSVQEFHDHLLSGAHVGGTVQCPSCLKRFKTTTALVAHAESGSMRCDLRNSAEYDLVMRSITAGLIRVDGTWSSGGHKFAAVPVDQW